MTPEVLTLTHRRSAAATVISSCVLGLLPIASMADEMPVYPDKVATCASTATCTIPIVMSLQAGTGACKFDVAGAVLVPSTVSYLQFTVASGQANVEFAFDYVTSSQPVFIKSFSKQSAWTVSAYTATTFTVDRTASDSLSATHYGVRALYRQSGGAWTHCPAALDPIIINHE